MAHSCADPERHAEWQAKENQHGELDQPSPAAGRGGKPVGKEGSEKKDDLVEQRPQLEMPCSAGIRV
ncbi:MAG: hypothetical protein Q7U25_07475 [Sulfuricella sp.]|nr:hypothetical protein [Sulfuricella sp.]